MRARVEYIVLAVVQKNLPCAALRAVTTANGDGAVCLISHHHHHYDPPQLVLRLQNLVAPPVTPPTTVPQGVTLDFATGYFPPLLRPYGY